MALASSYSGLKPNANELSLNPVGSILSHTRQPKQIISKKHEIKGKKRRKQAPIKKGFAIISA